jgi:DNA invertase Pin-like site-specific DNA recombinase
MTKAFAYLRVSGRGQVDGDGFPRQLEAIKRYAKAQNIRIVHVFEERGIGGATELENRPALMAMMEALAADGTKLVLIEKLDRLARDLMVQETIIGDLRKRGFDLVSVMEPDLLQTDPTRVLMRQIFGAIAQYEKAMIVAKLRGSRERAKARDGHCEGRKPYGHYPNEQAALHRMQQLRQDGTAFDKIAEALNAEGFRPRTTRRMGEECRWHAGVVHRILSKIEAVKSV